MRLLLSCSFSALVAAGLSGCAVMPAPEELKLGCGEQKETIYNIPTTTKPHPVGVSFKLACSAEGQGVEVSLKNHPWGGIGKTMPRYVGRDAPHYEYIPCENNETLKNKWQEFQSYGDFKDIGRDIQDINDVQVDMRFRQDYALRHFVLYSAQNICAVAPQQSPQ